MTDRRHLSFTEAEGLSPLPTQLQLHELSEEFRSLLWNELHSAMVSNAQRDDKTSWEWWAGDRWLNILKDWHVRKLFRPSDEFDPRLEATLSYVKNVVWHWEYQYLFDFLTFLLRHDQMWPHWSSRITAVFEEARAAYRVVEATIFPIATAEEGEAISRAFVAVSSVEFAGARSHLKEAGARLTSGDFAGSARESIHAVEAVARIIAPGSNTLAPALKTLSAAGHIHPALSSGFEKIYGYTNDEKGIRHPLLESAGAKVDEADAVYMLGTCAAFVSYLIARRPVA